MAENGTSRLRTLLGALVFAILGYFGQRFVSELDTRDTRAEERYTQQDQQIQVILAQHSQMLAMQHDTLRRVERMEKILLERTR